MKIPMPDTVPVNLWTELLPTAELQVLLAMVIAEMDAKIFRDPKTGLLYMYRD